MRQYKVGEFVMVHRGNDNENYLSFRKKTLVVTHVAKSEADHPGYDAGVGQPLYDLKEDLTNNPVPFSLYHYELERA